MKQRISLLLALVLLCSFLAIPVMATENQPAESTPTQSTEASQPPKEPESTAPSAPGGSDSTDPTQGSTPTEPSQPAVCTHVYGEWTADEVAHSRKCTLCGHAESNSHTWASETVTVDPTCGEAGGKCKICTVCAGVLVTELIAPTGKHTFDNACDTKCNVCGAERSVEHTFGTGWKYSGKGHWHYCTICGASDVIKEHYPGPAATEEKDQICLTCGMIMMKKKPHTHKWDTKWSNDESGHWYSCTICQEKDKTAGHSYDDGCDTDCNDCGYLRTAAHTYGSDWTQTEQTHYGVCTVCGENTSAETHIADSTGTACSICGFAMEATTEPHEHTFIEDTWGFDENGHWNTCMCGEKDNAEPHTWDDGVKKGKHMIHTCEICDAEKTEEVLESGFPWLLFAVGGGVLICLIGIVICVVLIIKNREYED